MAGAVRCPLHERRATLPSTFNIPPPPSLCPKRPQPSSTIVFQKSRRSLQSIDEESRDMPSVADDGNSQSGRSAFSNFGFHPNLRGSHGQSGVSHSTVRSGSVFTDTSFRPDLRGSYGQAGVSHSTVRSGSVFTDTSFRPNPGGFDLQSDAGSYRSVYNGSVFTDTGFRPRPRGLSRSPREMLNYDRTQHGHATSNIQPSSVGHSQHSNGEASGNRDAHSSLKSPWSSRKQLTIQVVDDDGDDDDEGDDYDNSDILTAMMTPPASGHKESFSEDLRVDYANDSPLPQSRARFRHDLHSLASGASVTSVLGKRVADAPAKTARTPKRRSRSISVNSNSSNIPMADQNDTSCSPPIAHSQIRNENGDSPFNNAVEMSQIINFIASLNADNILTTTPFTTLYPHSLHIVDTIRENLGALLQYFSSGAHTPSPEVDTPSPEVDTPSPEVNSPSPSDLPRNKPPNRPPNCKAFYDRLLRIGDLRELPKLDSFVKELIANPSLEKLLSAQQLTMEPFESTMDLRVRRAIQFNQAVLLMSASHQLQAQSELLMILLHLFFFLAAHDYDPRRWAGTARRRMQSVHQRTGEHLYDKYMTLVEQQGSAVMSRRLFRENIRDWVSVGSKYAFLARNLSLGSLVHLRPFLAPTSVRTGCTKGREKTRIHGVRISQATFDHLTGLGIHRKAERADAMMHCLLWEIVNRFQFPGHPPSSDAAPFPGFD